jgi:hypothetical protein
VRVPRTDSSMKTNLEQPLLIALLALGCASCGARWRSAAEAHAAQDAAPSADDAPSVSHARTSEELHGHRDFPATFERVWDATVQSIHAAGVGVPLAAREASAEGRIDVDELLVEVEEPSLGRTCVFVRFRGVSRSVGERRAKDLLDEVARRLRIQG